MKTLFDKTSIGNMTLRNRFIRAAVGEKTKDGHVNDGIVALYSALARGGAGALITGFTLVDEAEKSFPIMACYNDSFLDGHKRLAAAAREDGAAIILQLVYVGSYTIGDAGGRTTLAPSAVGHRNTSAVPREITPAEIKDIQERFAVAALRAKNAGYSGVEIHAAHGFFLSQFMTPYYNLRGDSYGGSTENRARMTLETYEAVRNAVGSDFPVLIKINVDDGFEGGVPFADVQYLCKKLAEKNIDAIEISGAWSNFPNKASSYFKREAATIAAAGGTKVIMTGGNKDWREMADILNNTNIEYFGMARALIEDKNLIKKFTQQFQQTAVGRDA